MDADTPRDSLVDAFVRLLALVFAAGLLVGAAYATFAGFVITNLLSEAPCGLAENECSATGWSRAAGVGVGLGTLVFVAFAIASVYCAVRFALRPAALWRRRSLDFVLAALGAASAAGAWTLLVYLVSWIAGSDMISDVDSA